MKIFNAKTQKRKDAKEEIIKDGYRFFYFLLFTFYLKIFASLRLCVFALILFSCAAAQSSVLIPTNENKPNPKTLSLAVMNVEITIDNNRANVKITQIFDNHTAQTLEGKYVFALSETSSIADFAVWDNDLRIPGVMMERRRANRIYDSIKQQQTDPGILQTTDDAESASGFRRRFFR
jgi:hypothetical protein